MTSLGVTLGGVPFPHLVFHLVLVYSNVEAVRICFSESYESLVEGLESCLWQVGGVPRQHRTDHLSAAIHPLDAEGRAEAKERYQRIMAHYGLQPTTNNLGVAHENGDVEQLERLRSGVFLEDAVNLVAAGKPGVGKSHALAAIGHELVLQGHPVLWTPTASLVQELLAAKRDLRLPQLLAKLDRYECVFLDDIGYVQHDRDEMEVLFTFLAERYERRSVAISTNLVFSDWNRIFKDPMTTMAAIDRVVHHSVILDMMAMDSYRARQASDQHARHGAVAPRQPATVKVDDA